MMNVDGRLDARAQAGSGVVAWARYREVRLVEIFPMMQLPTL
jgi:hypothetical protein